MLLKLITPRYIDLQATFDIIIEYRVSILNKPLLARYALTDVTMTRVILVCKYDHVSPKHGPVAI